MTASSVDPSLLNLARKGDIDACCGVAEALMRPETPEAYRAALPWLRRAAQVEPWAAYHIGLMFDHGRGVKRSVSRAISWYTRSSEGGYDSAQLNLGIVYANLPGQRRDFRRAMGLYRLAAGQGNLNAMFNLGLYYEEGRGVPQSKAQAMRWYQRAAVRGHRSAKGKLRRLLLSGA